jgi:hypothetical protein
MYGIGVKEKEVGLISEGGQSGGADMGVEEEVKEEESYVLKCCVAGERVKEDEELGWMDDRVLKLK